jgi:hypothetical protein
MVSSSIGAALLSGAPIALSLAPTSAVAATDFTCEAFVTYKDSGGHTGIQSLGPDKSVTSASECHQYTRTLFQGNAAWGTPSLVCANSNGRNFTGPTITVWAIDRFKEISETPQLYNRVISYVVDCALTGDVPAF